MTSFLATSRTGTCCTDGGKCCRQMDEVFRFPKSGTWCATQLVSARLFRTLSSRQQCLSRESVFVSERKMECGKEPYDCRPCYSRTASICQLQRGLSCVSRVCAKWQSFAECRCQQLKIHFNGGARVSGSGVRGQIIGSNNVFWNWLNFAQSLLFGLLFAYRLHIHYLNFPEIFVLQKNWISGNFANLLLLVFCSLQYFSNISNVEHEI